MSKRPSKLFDKRNFNRAYQTQNGEEEEMQNGTEYGTPAISEYSEN